MMDEGNINDEKDMIPLAPSGISPWDHHVTIDGGQLTLYWTQNSTLHLRTFTQEETRTLQNLLLALEGE